MNDFSYTPPLLDPDEAPAFTVLNEGGDARLILTCEHGGALVPRKLRLLGMEEEDFTKHYGVDVGIRRVVETLSGLLNAPAIIGNYSRLVVELNRNMSHPTFFTTSGEGKPVPANLSMAEEDKAARIAEIYDPYNRTLAAMLDRAQETGVVPVMVSVHSFTPKFFNFVRPWHFGCLWTHDPRLSHLIEAWFAARDYVVGDNQPYDHRITRGSAINRHADERKLPHTLVEIRNDLISNDKDGDAWANLLADCLHEVLADPGVATYYDGPLTDYDPDLEREYYERINAKAKLGEHYG